MANDPFASFTTAYLNTAIAGTPKKRPKKKTFSAGVIVPYKTYSRGARELSDLLGIEVDRRENFALDVMHHAYGIDDQTGTWRKEPKTRIPYLINWGTPNSSAKLQWLTKETLAAVDRVINYPADVTVACNKKLFFQKMSKAEDGPRIPEFTTNLEEAQQWAKDGIVVMGRKEHGHSGTDVAFFDENPEGFTAADLWTQYKKKKKEFRLHYMNGDFFLIQQKVLPVNDPEGNPIPKNEVDMRIRTHRTGFIFQKNSIVVPDDVRVQALKAIKASGLDFGAIDVIYNQHDDKAYVLEINTAPGLEGSTAGLYAEQFRKLLGAAALPAGL